MTAEEFRRECDRLARPCQMLCVKGAGKPVGVWGGLGAASPPGKWKHWVTVDCNWFEQNGFPLCGCLSVYENRDDSRSELGFVAVVGKEPLPLGSDGLLLYGAEESSLPPLEALELFGSEEMKECVRSENEASPLNQYNEKCPLHRKDIDVMLGGWHVPWPEDDAYDQREGRLVLWTFRDAEPWIEVWMTDAGQLNVVPRIT